MVSLSQRRALSFRESVAEAVPDNTFLPLTTPISLFPFVATLHLVFSSDMQSASGSDVLTFRETTSPLTGDFLLGHRYRTQCVNGSSHYLPVPKFSKPQTRTAQRMSPTTRAKRSTDSDPVFNGTTLQNNKLLQHFHHQCTFDTAGEVSRAKFRLLPSKSTDCETAVGGFFSFNVHQFSETARSATSPNTAPTFPLKCSHCSHSNINFSKPRSLASKPISTFKPLGLRSLNVVISVQQKHAERSLNSSGPSKSRFRIKVPPVKGSKSRGAENNRTYAVPATSISASSKPRTTLPIPSPFDVDDAYLSPTLVEVVDPTHIRLDPFSRDPSFPDFSLPSFDALDELALWDMSTFSSSRFSTDDSGLEQTNDDHSAASKRESSNHPPPFSTPFGDDDLLENELPFPTVRPRILMENMGVKKSKAVAADKARNLTGSSPRSRDKASFLHNEASTSKMAASFPSGRTMSSLPPRPSPNLPYPLPKPQSSNSPSPLNDDSLARTSTYLQGPSQPAPSRRKSPISQTVEPTISVDQDSRPLLSCSPTTSESDTEDGRTKFAHSGQSEKPFTFLSSQMKEGSSGCHHVVPDDCQLFIVFPQTDHYEFWDMSDQ